MSLRGQPANAPLRSIKRSTSTNAKAHSPRITTVVDSESGTICPICAQQRRSPISRSRGGSLQARFRRIERHRGEEKAIIALAHHLVVVIRWMLHEHVPYNEMGEDYLTRRIGPERRKRQLVHQPEQLGVKVTVRVEPAA